MTTKIRQTTLLLIIALLAHSQPATAKDKKGVKDTLDNARRERNMELRLTASHLRGSVRNLFKRLKPKWRVKQLDAKDPHKGSLSLGPGGIPIMRLKGSPEEMGRQHARLMKREIKILVREYIPAFLGKDTQSAMKDARRFIPHIPKAYLREIKAMAKAAGISFEEALLGHTFADQYRAWACSCVTATGKARGSKNALFGRNLDFIDMGFLHRFSIVTVVEPKQGKRFVSLGFPGMIGVISGMNEDGLAAAVMVVHSDSGCQTGTPFSLLFRQVLEQSQSVTEVEKQLKQAAITVTNNLMVCDATGAARVYELMTRVECQRVDQNSTKAGDCVTRKPNNDGLLYSTNHFNSKPLNELRASIVYLSSRSRYNTLKRVCRSGQRVSLKDVKASLAKTAPSAANVQAMIFCPKTRSIHVAFGKKPAAKRPFRHLKMALLFPTKSGSRKGS